MTHFGSNHAGSRVNEGHSFVPFFPIIKYIQSMEYIVEFWKKKCDLARYSVFPHSNCILIFSLSLPTRYCLTWLVHNGRQGPLTPPCCDRHFSSFFFYFLSFFSVSFLCRGVSPQGHVAAVIRNIN